MEQSIVLEEQLDESYEPGDDEIKEYAHWLGMDPEAERELLWVAREGLKAPLTENWKPCRTTEGDIYYFNFSTGESTWDHPCDEYYRKLYADQRERLRQRQEAERQVAAQNLQVGTRGSDEVRRRSLNGMQQERQLAFPTAANASVVPNRQAMLPPAGSALQAEASSPALFKPGSWQPRPMPQGNPVAPHSDYARQQHRNVLQGGLVRQASDAASSKSSGWSTTDEEDEGRPTPHQEAWNPQARSNGSPGQTVVAQQTPPGALQQSDVNGPAWTPPGGQRSPHWQMGGEVQRGAALSQQRRHSLDSPYLPRPDPSVTHPGQVRLVGGGGEIESALRRQAQAESQHGLANRGLQRRHSVQDQYTPPRAPPQIPAAPFAAAARSPLGGSGEPPPQQQEGLHRAAAPPPGLSPEGSGGQRAGWGVAAPSSRPTDTMQIVGHWKSLMEVDTKLDSRSKTQAAAAGVVEEGHGGLARTASGAFNAGQLREVKLSSPLIQAPTQMQQVVLSARPEGGVTVEGGPGRGGSNAAQAQLAAEEERQLAAGRAAMQQRVEERLKLEEDDLYERKLVEVEAAVEKAMVAERLELRRRMRIQARAEIQREAEELKVALRKESAEPLEQAGAADEGALRKKIEGELRSQLEKEKQQGSSKRAVEQATQTEELPPADQSAAEAEGEAALRSSRKQEMEARVMREVEAEAAVLREEKGKELREQLARSLQQEEEQARREGAARAQREGEKEQERVKEQQARMLDMLLEEVEREENVIVGTRRAQMVAHVKARVQEEEAELLERLSGEMKDRVDVKVGEQERKLLSEAREAMAGRVRGMLAQLEREKQDAVEQAKSKFVEEQGKMQEESRVRLRDLERELGAQEGVERQRVTERVTQQLRQEEQGMIDRGRQEVAERVRAFAREEEQQARGRLEGDGARWRLEVEAGREVERKRLKAQADEDIAQFKSALEEESRARKEAVAAEVRRQEAEVNAQVKKHADELLRRAQDDVRRRIEEERVLALSRARQQVEAVVAKEREALLAETRAKLKEEVKAVQQRERQQTMMTAVSKKPPGVSFRESALRRRSAGDEQLKMSPLGSPRGSGRESWEASSLRGGLSEVKRKRLEEWRAQIALDTSPEHLSPAGGGLLSEQAKDVLEDFLDDWDSPTSGGKESAKRVAEELRRVQSVPAQQEVGSSRVLSHQWVADEELEKLEREAAQEVEFRRLEQLQRLQQTAPGGEPRREEEAAASAGKAGSLEGVRNGPAMQADSFPGPARVGRAPESGHADRQQAERQPEGSVKGLGDEGKAGANSIEEVGTGKAVNGAEPLSVLAKTQAFLVQQKTFLRERQAIIEQARLKWKRHFESLEEVSSPAEREHRRVFLLSLRSTLEDAARAVNDETRSLRVIKRMLKHDPPSALAAISNPLKGPSEEHPAVPFLPLLQEVAATPPTEKSRGPGGEEWGGLENVGAKRWSRNGDQGGWQEVWIEAQQQWRGKGGDSSESGSSFRRGPSSRRGRRRSESSSSPDPTHQRARKRLQQDLLAHICRYNTERQIATDLLQQHSLWLATFREQLRAVGMSLDLRRPALGAGSVRASFKGAAFGS